MKRLRQLINKIPKRVLVIIAIVVYGVSITLLIAMDTTFTRVRAYVLTDPSYLNNAVIINQTAELYGFDEHDTLHVVIPVDMAKELITKNIMQDCVEKIDGKGCLSPTWVKYGNLPLDYFSNYLDGSGDSDKIMCTGQMPSVDATYLICIDPTTGDFWYDLNIW